MTYEKPEINHVGTAASVILGPFIGDPFDRANPPQVTSPNDLVLGLDD